MDRPRFITKSLSLAESMLPDMPAKAGYRTFHFCFGWHRNRLLAIGVNGYRKDGRTHKVGKLFGTHFQREYPYPHAEVDMIQKLLSKIHIDSRLKVVSLRLNRKYELKQARPCRACMTVLEAFNIRRVWFSNSQGEVVQL